MFGVTRNLQAGFVGLGVGVRVAALQAEPSDELLQRGHFKPLHRAAAAVDALVDGELAAVPVGKLRGERGRAERRVGGIGLDQIGLLHRSVGDERPDVLVEEGAGEDLVSSVIPLERDVRLVGPVHADHVTEPAGVPGLDPGEGVLEDGRLSGGHTEGPGAGQERVGRGLAP